LRCQRGVTLVEALIALLVVSVGLLGIAALQTVALQEAAATTRHSQAVWLAYNMADRMRANRAPADWTHCLTGEPIRIKLLPGATAPNSASDYDGVHVLYSDSPSGPSCGAGANCSAGDMVDVDAAQWLAGIQGLPEGEGAIAFVAGANCDQGGLYRIRVMWRDVRGRLDQEQTNTNAAQGGCPSDTPDPTAKSCVELWVQP